jgi:YbbR domain-containing protein
VSRWVEWWKPIFTENPGLKLFSLALACLLWFFIAGGKKKEITVEVPLVLQNVPADVVIVSPVPESVRVRLAGSRTALANLGARELSATLDLSNLRPGTATVELTQDRIQAPRSVLVRDISPSSLVIEVDPVVTRRLPVAVRYRGTPAPGWTVTRLKASPAEVTLQGARRHIDPLESVSVEPVDVSNAERSVSAEVAPRLPAPSLKRVGRDTPIRVEVTLRRGKDARAGREDDGRVPQVGP